MPIDVQKLTDKELENLMENHCRQGATNRPLYVDAMRELEKRKGGGLEFDKSYNLILGAAREGRFLSYKELADGSGAKWEKVHYSLGSHLWQLVKYADLKGWPMLSAIVVNKPNVSSGKMDPPTLKGFVGAARELGYEVTDDEAFLKEQQERVFAWAKHRGAPQAPVPPGDPAALGAGIESHGRMDLPKNTLRGQG
jgi:hypothetical protein